MKKYLLAVLLGLLVLDGCARILSPEDDWLCTDQGWVKHGNPSAPMPTWACGNKTETETVTEPPQSDEVKSETGGRIKISEKPVNEARTESEGDFESPPGVVEGNIVVEFPKPGDTVDFPFKAYGKARVFENQFSWRLKNSSGKIVGQGQAMANSPDMGKYGPYQIEVGFAETNGTNAMFEVFDNSAKDGAEQDMVSVPIKIGQTASLGVKLFFANDRLDPDVTCEKVFSVDRTIPKTKSVAKAVMEELLKGTNSDEESRGFRTTINPGVKINRLVIVDGVAQVDFDAKMEYQMGGSCRVNFIRQQIVETLKQFPAVKDVIISIDGRTEDILQP